MHLEWSVFARSDRKSIFDYIEADNPQAAITLDERIEECILNLVQFPLMGRTGRIEGTRELVINRTPYVAAYRVTGETITILRVLHGAQQWPDSIPEQAQ
jgi:toxin ParE1/3/4